MNSVRSIMWFLFIGSALCEVCVDEWSNTDCTIASNEGYATGYLKSACYLYSDVCHKSCGCDYDPTFDRWWHRLDDAHYESSDFQCVIGDEFEDKMNFNCTLYEGANWCMVNDDGEVVEGPGWCNWLGPDSGKCNIPMGLKWPRHDGYANRDGQWAKSCCCDTGLADTYPYEESSPGFGGDCIDLIGNSGAEWNDKNAYSCRAYHFGSFCTMDGGYGTGWKIKDYGPFVAYWNDGHTPLEACCACGGGNWLSSSSVIDRKF